MSTDPNTPLHGLIVRVARSMGYRKFDGRDAWCKPFGFTLLFIDPALQEIGQAFRGVDGKNHVWSSMQLDGADESCERFVASLETDEEKILARVKYFETYNVRQIDASMCTQFQFTTAAEWAEEALES